MDEATSARMRGGEQLVERAREIAVEEGIGPIGAEWVTDLTEPHEKHKLHIEDRTGLTCEIAFHRETLEAYPGQVGTEDVDTKLRMALAEFAE